MEVNIHLYASAGLLPALTGKEVIWRKIDQDVVGRQKYLPQAGSEHLSSILFS
jgi:hypothetical protein